MKRGNFKINKIRGYTLVEMAVVMTIMAVISSIGVGAWISTRKQAYVDDAAEQLVTAIRDSQNKAFAVTKNGTEDTKAWTVIIEDNQGFFREGSFYKEDNGSQIIGWGSSPDRATGTGTKQTNLSGGTIIQIKDEAGNDLNGQYFVSFSTPFGLGCLLNNGSGSNWTDDGGVRPAGDYRALEANLETGALKIELTNGNTSRTVVLKPNGDVYVEK